MTASIKTKIYQLLEDINDETILNQVMEDISFYASKNDVTETLTAEQLNELNLALIEGDTGDTLPWDDFKQEMHEWKRK